MEQSEFDQAVIDLQWFIFLEVGKVDYKVVDNAPSTFKDMKQFYETHGYFAINGESSNTSIYSLPWFNVAFRAIHDKMHYETGLTFTYKDEKKLSTLTANKVYLWAMSKNYGSTRSMNMYKLVDAEIKGQIEYHEQHGKFLDNQKKYIKEYLNVIKA